MLSPGPFTFLTDGAGAYQSVAPLNRIAYHTLGRDPDSWSKVRYESNYKNLKISHGIVSHKAEQWAEKDSVKVINAAGAIRTIKIKKGTQCVDGLWPEMRGAIPHSVHSGDWDRCLSYIWAWVWRSRRTGKDLLREFGSLLHGLRQGSS